MKYLFEEDGLRALEAFAMSNTLAAFDYDGTLAPIVDNPDKAIMRPTTSKLVEKIANLAPVAVISGRSQSDVMALMETKVDFVIGNHGLEGLPSGSATLNHATSACRRWMEAIKRDLTLESVTVEDKLYSIAIHYRHAADKKRAKMVILEVCGSLEPSPRIVMGKFVVNLLSAGAPHKGVALLELMLKLKCRSAIYFGDDDNDEDVFRLADESILTVRVEKHDESSALFYVRTQEEVDDALRIIEQSMRRSGKVPRVQGIGF